jgi:hypothetical protein
MGNSKKDNIFAVVLGVLDALLFALCVSADAPQTGEVFRIGFLDGSMLFSDNLPTQPPPGLSLIAQGGTLALYSAVLARNRIESKQDRMAIPCTDHRD